jgi:hypothetical protein
MSQAPPAKDRRNYGRPAIADEKEALPMHLAKLLKLCTLLAVLALVVSAAAQQITYENFSIDKDYNLLDRNGTATRGTWNGITVLRLTDGSSANRPAQGVPASSVWFSVPQRLSPGFTTYFKFIIHNPLQCCDQGLPGDGLAFVMQSAGSADASLCASGARTTAIGYAPGGLGYTGIPNSAALEFDTHQDAWDPNANHVALQSCGKNPNTPVHDSNVYNMCSNNNVKSCLYSNAISTAIPPIGVACGNGGCIDGVPATVVVEYTGTSKTDPHHLYVYVDPLLIPGTHTPVPNATPQINLPGFRIENVIPISPTANGVTAFVGFTASGDTQTTDVISWEFTPHTPTQITETINSGGVENKFNFGDHVYGVTYPMDFNNQFGDTMTVNAMPTGQADFYTTRLQNNTLFNNEQCVRYYSTGSSAGSDGSPGPNCIVYEVTCQCGPMNPNCMQGQNIACPNPDNKQQIGTRTSYSTPDPINANNADYIKTPIGTNNWCSIFTEFIGGNDDPTNVGSGNNFSDFVATFKTGPGQDPQCPMPGGAMLRKLPQTNASAPTVNSQAEPGPAGANK